jgi:tetratricopeptide (TPR) repeat protein
MIAIDPYVLLVLIACLYTLLFGGMALMRREGLSVQFVFEVAILTVLLVGGAWLLGLNLSPFLFLIVLYLVTMRSRLVVDLANLLARRGNYDLAFRLYALGLAWRPDDASRLIVLTNRGIAECVKGDLDAAIHTLERVLAEKERPRLGAKYEAACRYNLGYAFEKKGEEALAVRQYNEVVDLLPGSMYGRAAEAALKRRSAKHE